MFRQLTVSNTIFVTESEMEKLNFSEIELFSISVFYSLVELRAFHGAFDHTQEEISKT